MMRSLLLALIPVAVLFCTGMAQAKETQAKDDIANGKRLTYTCAGCHGVPGYQNAYPNYRVPRIAGQHKQYLITALHEYKSGARKHPTMNAQMYDMPDQDIKDIAAYLSSLPKK